MAPENLTPDSPQRRYDVSRENDRLRNERDRLRAELAAKDAEIERLKAAAVNALDAIVQRDGRYVIDGEEPFVSKLQMQLREVTHA